jgi:hypothetical protein
LPGNRINAHVPQIPQISHAPLTWTKFRTFSIFFDLLILSSLSSFGIVGPRFFNPCSDPARRSVSKGGEIGMIRNKEMA